MPSVTTYARDSATALEIQRIANPDHIANWNSNFDADDLDGLTDVTTVLNAAMTAARATATEFFRPKVFLPSGTYLISDTVDCQRVSVVSPGATILCEDVGANKPAFSWDQSNEEQWPLVGGYAAEGLFFQGRDTVAKSVTFTANTWAIGAAAPGLRFRNILAYNFDSFVRWGQYAYLQKFEDCKVQYCNIAIEWPELYTTSGENVAFYMCNFSNNDVGVRVAAFDTVSSQVTLNFFSCSIDYNVSNHLILVKPTTSENDQLAVVNMVACHLETGSSTSGSSTPRIENGGILKLTSCTIYETGAFDFIINTPYPGRCTLIGNEFIIPGGDDYCEGNGDYRAYANQQRYGGTVNITSTITNVAS